MKKIVVLIIAIISGVITLAYPVELEQWTTEEKNVIYTAAASDTVQRIHIDSLRINKFIIQDPKVCWAMIFIYHDDHIYDITGKIIK